jgi:peptidoglycan/xylan/chitin deacetylase (PgdA/CDA1 family)
MLKHLIIILISALICRCAVYKPSLQFDEHKKYILLTFDDGPNNHKNTTRQVLEVLGKHKVKALFNLIGMNVDRYPDITREIHNNGHIIANHGYTVMPVLFRSRKKIKWEVDSCTAALQRALNDSLYKPLYFRPSMGWYNSRTIKIIRERNMKVNGMTIYAVDTKKSTDDTDKVIKEIVKKAERHNGGVIVLHDGIAEYTWLERRLKQGWKNYDRSFIPVVTDSIITILKREGFAFPKLDENSPHDLSEEERIFFKDIIYF